MNKDLQTLYQEAIVFATQKHVEKQQHIPGTQLPYVVHLSNVAMEILIANQNTVGFRVNFAIQLALLHDTLEDTNTTYDELFTVFGKEVADGVQALTKNTSLPKNLRMSDSLHRIKQLPKEVWAVKLADRITNLQKPPQHWDLEKIKNYKTEAEEISKELEGGNIYLKNRLRLKIENYMKYC